MHYYLYKLNFPNGVHFGSEKSGVGLEKITCNCHCDTFFSALCIEVLKMYGEESLNKFIKEAKNGEFLFSDLLPYAADELYIPKPILYKERSEEKTDSVQKKKMKKLQFVPIGKLSEYFDGNVEEVKFFETALYEKNGLSRDGSGENGLYSVAVTKFFENCGLYFVVKMSEENKAWFDKVLKSLSYSGLGGKRTSGYGRFEIADDCELDEKSNIQSEALMAKALNSAGNYYLTLSVFYPKKEEIEKLKSGYYTLLPRLGYVQSQTYSKKISGRIPSVMVNAGSCFSEKFEGDIPDLKKDGEHSVYRYGKPIMIGID